MNDTRTGIDAPAVDSATASVARAYDYFLGGKDHFEADRVFARNIMARDPDVPVTARLNKEFGRRAVDYMARNGIEQFLDLGSGIPTSPPSVHDTARRVRSAARVVYVDHDPVVVAQNRALRTDGSGLAVIQESFLDAQRVFGNPELLSTIDLARPVGVLFLSVFQNTADDVVDATLADLRSRLAPGSHLAISHITDNTAPEVQDAFNAEAAAGRYPKIAFRSEQRIAEFFTGFDLVDPGVVDYRDWRPTERDEDDRPELKTVLSGAVGRYQG